MKTNETENPVPYETDEEAHAQINRAMQPVEMVEMPKGLFEVLKQTFENLPAGAMPGTVAQVSNLLHALNSSRIVPKE